MLDRRTMLAATTALAAALATGRPAAAQQAFSSLRMFIPAGPGGGWDGLGRAIEQVLRGAGKVGSFQFENVGGAGGTVGLPRFMARRGQGDTMLVGGAIMIGAVLTNKTPVGLKDVTPIARLTEEAGVIVVPANSPHQDIAGFLQALKANPGAISVGGGSAGGIDHITLGLMLKTLGRSAREASYVAYAGGGAALAAILGGQVTAGISGLSEFSEQIKAGRMRALATTGEKRTDPAIPTLKESGTDVVAANWRGVFGAPAISAAQKTALTTLMTEMHALPAWQEMLKTRGWDDAFLAGDAFAKFILDDTAATETVLKDVGLV
jgi:putative tricarboxylic transport membrane protein